MSIPVIDALKQAHLEPGTIRAVVNGYEVELKVAASPSGAAVTDGPPAFEPWAVLPLPGSAVTTTAVPGEPFLPKPVELDESDFAPE